MMSLIWIPVVIVAVYILGALSMSIWLASEESKQDQERQRFERIMQASAPRIIPRASGYPSRKVGK